ncbi:hypothetical protein [Bacillus sp. FJAT-27245]|uniref:hypothetical protein n=1 Tax=Bacillus sp. FJAT-27245 TaxID=1684144 RepID=UPI0006A7E83F|nr:hypothetical protein [Bacillus sp. FJAT-27245]
MDDKRQFLKLLAPVKRQLRLARVFAAAQYGLASAGAGCVIVLLLARMVVFPYYYEAAAVCSILAFLSVFLFFIRRLPGWKEAAGLYNSYVPEDRVIAAHSFQDQDGPIEKLLIKETVSYMKREQARVLSRKKKYRITKWLAAGILLAAAALSLEQFPNKKIELAEKRKTEIAIVKKAEENISAQMKKEKNPLAKKELEELKKELAKARTPEEALNTIERKKKELVLKELKEKDLNSGLESLITEMEEAGLKKLASAIAEKDVEKAMAEIGRLSKDGAQRTPAQSAALKKLAGTDGALSGKQLDSLQKKIKESFQSGNELRELAALQDTVTKQGQMLRGEMVAKGLLRGTLAMGPEKNIHNGQAPSAGGKGKNDPLNSGNAGTQSGSSPNKSSTPGSGSGNGKGNGTGTGDGTGAGQGTGAGGGKGAGSSAGQGANPGKGAGLGEGPREFLTIPEKIGGNTNLESDFGKLGEGNTSQYESDGPVQRGTIRPYEEVYGEYADSYRNSLDRMKLPGGLENIVKNYFSDLDPKKE